MTSWSQGIRRPERSSLPFVMTSKRLPTAGGRAYFCGLIFSSSLYSTTYHLFCIKWGVLCGLRTGRRPALTFIHSLKAAAAVLTTMYVFTSCMGPSRTIHKGRPLFLTSSVRFGQNSKTPLLRKPQRQQF